MRTTLLLVLHQYTIKKFLTARYALDLDFKSLCIKVEIFNFRKGAMTAAVPETVSKLQEK